MALNKNKSNEALSAHAIVYSLCFLPFGFWFAFFTLVLHWMTDYHTSRATSKLWFIKISPIDTEHTIQNFFHYEVLKGHRHWFFVMIGFDQLIHFVTLAATYHLLVR